MLYFYSRALSENTVLNAVKIFKSRFEILSSTSLLPFLSSQMFSLLKATCKLKPNSRASSLCLLGILGISCHEQEIPSSIRSTTRGRRRHTASLRLLFIHRRGARSPFVTRYPSSDSWHSISTTSPGKWDFPLRPFDRGSLRSCLRNLQTARTRQNRTILFFSSVSFEFSIRRFFNLKLGR